MEYKIISELVTIAFLSVLSIAFFWSDEDISIQQKLLVALCLPILILSYKYFEIYGFALLYLIYSFYFFKKIESGIIFSIISPVIFSVASAISLSPFIFIFLILKLILSSF